MIAPAETARIREFEFSDEDFRSLRELVREVSGITLSEAKRELVYGRLSRRLRALGLTSFRDYRALLAGPEGKEEIGEFTNAVTTNLTSFFRENHHFEHLKTEVLPELIARAKAGGRVRIWSAACSDGQEPYSIALTVLSMLPNASDYDFRILATDIDPKILAQARAGAYDATALETVAPAIRNQYFREVEIDGRRRWQVDDRVKRLITYNELNLIAQWPFKGPFDAIFCRNVVIYFDEPTQMKIWSRFAGMLTAGGYLYIGHSERVSGEAKASFDNTGITTYRYNGKERRA